MGGTLRPAFGAHALPGALERLRRAGSGLGTGPVARRVASAIRRICVAGRPDPFDVSPFPGQRARLYPRDNLSEKRVFTAPQFWDGAERAALAAAIRGSSAPFHFVDAGANAGLYCLALRAEGPIRALAIEPDAENLRRLRDNLAASEAEAEVTVVPVALSDRPGELTLAEAGRNRGEIALAPASDPADGAPSPPARGGEKGPAPTVEAVPLLGVLRAAGWERVDALKIDIEGAEEPVLRAFLADAPRALWPGLIVIEAHRGAEIPALALLTRNGYGVTGRTRMNAILAAPERAPDRPH